ncbi:MAG: AAA family ATPase [Prochlorococcaceae cyanobacterium]
MAADQQAKSQPRPASTFSSTDAALDERRIAAVLADGIIRPSEDGEFDYWVTVLNAAASSGSELIRDAFFIWHDRCHHSKTQKRVVKRYDRNDHRSIPGKILSLAKEQHGDGWWRMLPEELWYSDPSTSIQPLYTNPNPRAPHVIAADIPPDQMPDPPRDDFTAEEQQLLDKRIEQARQQLLSPLGPNEQAPASYPDDTTRAGQPQRMIERGSLEDWLWRLYRLRSQGLILDERTLTWVPCPSDARLSMERALLGMILENRSYNGSTAEVDADLLTMFRREHDLTRDPSLLCSVKMLTGRGKHQVQWVIPDWILQGQEHVIIAKAGVGKTYFSLHLARAIVGDPEVTRFLDVDLPETHHRRWRRAHVLYIASDMNGSAEENTEAYLQKLELDGKDFLEQIAFFMADPRRGLPAWQMDLKGLQQLHEHLAAMRAADTPVAAVIIDAMKSVCPDNLLVGMQHVKYFLELVADICAHFGASLIWLHHTRANASEGAQGIQRIAEGASAVFSMERMPDGKSVKLSIEKIRGGAVQRKLQINPFSAGAPTLEADLSAPDSGCDFADEQMADASSHSLNDPDHPTRHAILGILRKHLDRYRAANPGQSPVNAARDYRGLGRREIDNLLPAYLRLRERSFRAVLSEMVRAGQIESRGSARALSYRLCMDLTSSA